MQHWAHALHTLPPFPSCLWACQPVLREHRAALTMTSPMQGPRMVRDVFRLAKENAPAIIFIDEVDAIATARFDAQTGADRCATSDKDLGICTMWTGCTLLACFWIGWACLVFIKEDDVTVTACLHAWWSTDRCAALFGIMHGQGMQLVSTGGACIHALPKAVKRLTIFISKVDTGTLAPSLPRQALTGVQLA